MSRFDNYTPSKSAPLLESVKSVAAQSESVAIDAGQIERVCAAVSAVDLVVPNWNEFVHPAWDIAERVSFFMLFNTVNFCYWGEPRWSVIDQNDLNRRKTGSLALLAALRIAYEDGVPIFDGDFLAQISIAQARRILCGEEEIPLFDERVAIWRRIGKSLLDGFGGHFYPVFRSGNGDALSLVQLLVSRFPDFLDASNYRGKQILFHKRAQLAVAQIYGNLSSQDSVPLANIRELTVFADYRLPQTLHALGILKYSAALTRQIAAGQLLPKDSPEEVEIRANTVWAGELIRQALAPRFPWVTALQIDYWLWMQRQHVAETNRLPHHKTLTTAY